MLLKNPNPDVTLTNTQEDLATEGKNIARGTINGIVISLVCWAVLAGGFLWLFNILS